MTAVRILSILAVSIFISGCMTEQIDRDIETLFSAVEKNDSSMCSDINDSNVRQNCVIRFYRDADYPDFSNETCEELFDQAYLDLCLDDINDRRIDEGLKIRFLDAIRFSASDGRERWEGNRIS